MKIVKIFTTFLFFATASHNIQASSFNALDPWEKDKLYQRGDIVRLDYDIYVSIVPSKGKRPNDRSARWKLIDYNSRRDFKPYTLYGIGAVVTHNERFYISRGINVALWSAWLQDSRRWLEFTHPGLIYDLPPVPNDPESEASLIGVDANHNGIRDDYELKIIFSDLPQPVKTSALAAGKAYGDLMASSLEETEINRDTALSIMHNLVLARACRTKLQALHGGARWEDTTYFDTLDRIEAKFKLQWMLQAALGQEGYNLPRDSAPCAALNSLQ